MCFQGEIKKQNKPLIKSYLGLSKEEIPLENQRDINE